MITPGAVPGYRREALYAVQAARALAPWWELDILCPMLGRQGHVVEFHGAKLLRVPLEAQDASAAGGFVRAVQRQLADGVYDAVHVRTPLEGSVALGMHDEHGFALVYDPAPPTGLTRVLDAEGATEKLLAGQSQLIDRCDLLVVHGRHAHARAMRLHGAHRRIVDVSHGVDTDVFGRLELDPGDLPIVLDLDAAATPLELPGATQRSVDEPWGSEYFKPESGRDLAMCLNAAALCVTAVPSRDPRWFESMPFGVAEAICCARPVLAPRGEAVAELLGDGCDRFLYDPDDAQGLRHAAGQLLAGGAELEGQLERLSERIRRCYPASAMRAKLVEGYLHILGPASDFPALPQCSTGS